MVSSRYKHVFRGFVEAIARPIARTGISPNGLSVAVPVLTGAVCWWFVRTQAIVPFCIAMFLVGYLDAMDGAVARMTNRVTKFGSYLDAVCDRYVEAIVGLAVAIVTGYWLLIIAALAGFLLVSYAKARTAIEVPISNQEWPDFMERSERCTVFLAGLFLGDVVPWHPLGHDLFWWTLVLLVALVHFTVLQRVFRARRYILERYVAQSTSRNAASPQSIDHNP